MLPDYLRGELDALNEIAYSVIKGPSANYASIHKLQNQYFDLGQKAFVAADKKANGKEKNKLIWIFKSSYWMGKQLHKIANVSWELEQEKLEFHELREPQAFASRRGHGFAAYGDTSAHHPSQ